MKNLNPSLITRQKAKRLGLKRYFTGEPCPKGHIEERDVAGRHCFGCTREHARNRIRDSNYIYNPSLKQHLWNRLGDSRTIKDSYRKSKRASGLNFDKNDFFAWYEKNLW